ncbi:MAG: UDP-N-acetylmuramoyl-L-alanine--D-glutamate ligase [Chthoniobacterales bacterium]
MTYKGKHTVVLGLGRSGEAAALLLQDKGADVTVCDSASEMTLCQKAESLRARKIRVLTGNDADTDSTVYDLAVLSPGIDPETPLVRNIVNKGIRIIGELELAFEECACPTVAITGTNGKTTTTELTTRMLQQCGLRTIASGNIGLPFSEAVRDNKEMDVMVIEISSFQLETIQTFRPHVAVWTNFSANHLDRYRSVDDYRNAKLRIFENQKQEDYAVVNLRDTLPPLRAKTVAFSAHQSGGDFELRGTEIFFRDKKVLNQEETNLSGVHNAENLMAALGVGYSLGIDFERMAEAVKEYHPPAHRCELVRDLEGVRYINDSKATNLNAMEMAIRSQTGTLILIAGGKDKGFEFDGIASLIRERVKAAVLIGEMKERIARDWKEVPTYCEATLEAAVKKAQSLSTEGSTVLFSPGTSSFDMFQNYVERGNRFKDCVTNLTPTKLQPQTTP